MKANNAELRKAAEVALASSIATSAEGRDADWFSVEILNEFLLVPETKACGPFIAAAKPSVILRLLAEAAWQPIATAPTDGRWVLLYLPDPGPHLVSCGIVPAKWIGGSGGWTTRGVQGITGMTHWMPLPKEPLD